MRDYGADLAARWLEASSEIGDLTLEFLAFAEGRFLTIHPFTYLGQANHITHKGERPVKMVRHLDHPMPAEIFENCRMGG